MKRALLLVCGSIVSLAVAAEQPAARAGNQPAVAPTELRAPRGGNMTASPPAPVPRGDLRSDIENNARSRGEPPHSGNARQPR